MMNDVKDVNDLKRVNEVKTVNDVNDERSSKGERELIWETFFSQLLYSALWGRRLSLYG